MTYIIAEAGINHNGDLFLALELVKKAAQSGADAVKFQTFVAREEVSQFAPKAEYQLQGTDESESQLEMIEKLEIDREQHIRIIDCCRECIRRAIRYTLGSNRCRNFGSSDHL